MTTTSDTAMFKWLLEKEPVRPGDVCVSFKGGTRLSIRPIMHSKCDGTGKELETGETCKCIRDVCSGQARAAKTKLESTGVDYRAVNEVEKGRMLRLEGQMAQIQAEMDAIKAQGAERQERYVKVLAEQRENITKHEQELQDATRAIATLEEGRSLLEKQKAQLEGDLKANRERIMEQQNAAVKLSNDIKQAQETISDAQAATASMAAGNFGERYEKLKGALAKREPELADAKQKVESLETKAAAAVG